MALQLREVCFVDSDSNTLLILHKKNEFRTMVDTERSTLYC